MTRSTQNNGVKIKLLRLTGRSLLSATVILSILALSSVVVSASIGTPVTCPLLKQPVTIDGKWSSATEWSDAPEIQMAIAQGNGVGYFRVKHDATYLYVLGEFLAATSLTYSTVNDHGDIFMVYLDTLNNQGHTPKTDDYGFRAFWTNATYTFVQTKKGNGTNWLNISPVDGVQAMIALDTSNSPHTPHPHVTAEFRIPLSIISTPTFGFFASFLDSAEAMSTHFFWPNGGQVDQKMDPSTWGTITISSTPTP